MTGPVVPNLFIVGAPKCGTTAMVDYLSDHPDVFFSTPKEPFYLCDDYPHLREQHSLKTDADYFALFEAGRGRAVVGEGSTNYMRSLVAVERALELSPDAKFIVMLRNPVDIAHAFHGEQLYARNESIVDFEEAWRLCAERRLGRRIPEHCRAPEFLDYEAVASIGTQLERLMSAVPEKRLLVMFQEDLAGDAGRCYRSALRFLDLPDDARVDFERVNSSHAHRSSVLAAAVLSPPRPLRPPINAARQYFRLRRPWLIEAIKRWQKVEQKRKPIPDQLRNELELHFADEVRLVEKLTGRSLG